MDLVCGNRRSPKQRESYVCERTLLRSAGGPILSLHQAVIGCRAAESDAIALVVGAHTGKSTAPGDAAFEMVDMRRFEVWPSGLVVAAVLVQPGNWIRIGATVRSHRFLYTQRRNLRPPREREQGQGGTRFQHASATAAPARIGKVVNRCTSKK